MATRRIDSYIPGAFGVSGVRSLVVEEELYANQARLDFTKTTATHKIITLPKDSLLEMVIVKNITEFDGALKLGKSGSDEEFLKDADFPKVVGLSNPLMIGAPISANTTVQLKVSGCSAGSGRIWIFWRPLL
jgi:hypothetical protein